MRNTVLNTVLPVVWFGVILGFVYWSTGCAVSARLMTHSQYQNQSRDRVLIDRGFGDYNGDNAIPNPGYMTYPDPLATHE